MLEASLRNLHESEFSAVVQAADAAARMIREVCSSPDPLTKYAASCLAATVRKLIHTRSAAHTHSPPPAAGCQLSSTTPGAARTRPLDAGERRRLSTFIQTISAVNIRMDERGQEQELKHPPGVPTPFFLFFFWSRRARGSDRQQASHPPAAADSHDAAARPAASICLASQG